MIKTSHGQDWSGFVGMIKTGQEWSGHWLARLIFSDKTETKKLDL